MFNAYKIACATLALTVVASNSVVGQGTPLSRQVADAQSADGATNSVDKDNIRTFVRQETKGASGPLEESELEEILDRFEKKHKIFLPDREMLVTSGLNAKSLEKALEKSAIQSGVTSAEAKTNRKRWMPIGPAVQNGKFDERQKLPGLTSGANDAYHPNGVQKAGSIGKDYRSEASRSYGGKPFSTEPTQKKANPYFNPEPSIRELNDRATEYYSNGKPRYDDQGNEVYPNGRRKRTDDGTPLYSNGRRRIDTTGRPLHSNGSPKLSAEGTPLFANGAPKVSETGAELRRDGSRATTEDGRALHANGRPVETVDGVKLHENGRRQFGGDGQGESKFPAQQNAKGPNSDPNLAKAPNVPRATPPKPTEQVVEVFSNGKRAVGANGERLYSNGQKRANADGQLLFPNGRPTTNGASQAVGPNGGLIAARTTSRGGKTGLVSHLTIVEGRVANKAKGQIQIQPRGLGEDPITIPTLSTLVVNDAGADPTPVSADALTKGQTVRLLQKTQRFYRDGEVLEEAAPITLVLLASSLSMPPPTDGPQKMVFLVAGSLASVEKFDIAVETEPRKRKTWTTNNLTMVQRNVQGESTPVPLAGLSLASRVRLVVEQTLTYRNGKITDRGDPIVLAVLQP